jgi:phospholipase A2
MRVQIRRCVKEIPRKLECGSYAALSIQALWFSRAEEYAFRRGLSTWPKGARWPAEIQPSDSPSPRGADEVDTDEVSAMRAARKLAVQQEVQVEDQATKKASSSKGPAHNQLPQLPSNSVKVGTLGEPEKVYIWIGSSQPTSSSKVSDSDTEEELAFRDGIGIVYIPLVTSSMASNPGELVSTWRLELKQEETEGLLDVAKVCLMNVSL